MHDFHERRVIKRYNVHQLKGSHVSLYRIAHEVKKCHVYNAEEDNEDAMGALLELLRRLQGRPGPVDREVRGPKHSEAMGPAVLKQLERARRQCGNTVLTDVVL